MREENEFSETEEKKNNMRKKSGLSFGIGRNVLPSVIKTMFLNKLRVAGGERGGGGMG